MIEVKFNFNKTNSYILQMSLFKPIYCILEVVEIQNCKIFIFDRTKY